MVSYKDQVRIDKDHQVRRQEPGSFAFQDFLSCQSETVFFTHIFFAKKVRTIRFEPMTLPFDDAICEG